MKRSILLFALAALLAPSMKADEGMWPYNRIPEGLTQNKHGFEITQEFLDRLQGASVRFNNGGSGAFVSPSGLVMTNHHVASGCIRKLSSKEKDYIADGFYAGSQAGEMQCPDLELNVLVEIETVTERVNQDVTAEMSESERLEAQKKATAAIEKECMEETGYRCDVVNLYQGGIFDLYKYKRYTDVRLAFAPEFKAAFFGGDKDNFTYPRYCLDVAFLRVYEDGEPAAPPAYLPWSKSGASENELVFVSGHPGSTSRLLTKAQLEFERDRRIPFMLDWIRALIADLEAYRRTGGDAERQARDELFRFNNSLKAYTGMLRGLRRQGLMETKAAAEKKLREAVQADPELSEQFGGAWEAIAAAQKVKADIYEEYRLIESGLGLYSRLFGIARDLYRLSEELPKANSDRLEEYQDSALESLYQKLYSPAPIYDGLETVKLSSSLTFLRERLGADHSVVAEVLGEKAPKEAAQALVLESRLKDVELRKKLGAGEAKLAAESEDPMIELARRIDGEARQLRKTYEDEVEAVENAHGARIARARFAVEGEDAYPDATFTLRLSVGAVKSYEEDGGRIEPFTTMAGLYKKAGPEDPYQLPKRFVDRQPHVRAETPYNLVSTNDIVGGNSGSPLVNRRGEIVGIIFDGNIHSLSNSYLYSEKQARAVSVDSRGIMEALRSIYRARRVVDELTSARAPSG